MFLFHSFALHGLSRTACIFRNSLGSCLQAPSLPFLIAGLGKVKPASDLCQTPVKMADSKPRLSISLRRKIKLIEEVEANPHKLKKAIADEQQIPPVTLSNILKNREKYKKQFYSGDNLLKKRDRACQHGEVDAELLKWFKGLRYVLPEYAHAHSPLPLLAPPTPPPLSLSLSLGTSRPKLTCACQKQNGHLVQCVLSHMLLLSFQSLTLRLQAHIAILP